MNRAQRRHPELVLPNGATAQPPPPAQSVAVGFCHSQDNMVPQFRRSLASVYIYDSRSRRVPRIVDEFDLESSGVHIPDARCDMVEAFLSHPLQPEWLWMIDADATFAHDILDRFMEVADPDTHPIVGALAFGVAPLKDDTGKEAFNTEWACEWELFPTLYYFDERGQAQQFLDYPIDTLIPVQSTGCHCFIVHRRVLEDPRWREDGNPLPWFRVANIKGAKMSEDQFFFVKAGALGYPTHVDTSIKTGHVKTYVADEDLYLSQRFDRGRNSLDVLRGRQTMAYEAMVADADAETVAAE